MRAILIDPARRTLAEVQLPPARLAGLSGGATITMPAWRERYGHGERVVPLAGPDEGAFRVDVPCCAGMVFRGRSVIVGGDASVAISDSQMELSVAKQIINWSEK